MIRATAALLLVGAAASAQIVPAPLAGRVYAFGGTTDTLVVVLHGDLSDGQAADYHQPFASGIAAARSATTAVALIRPGYADSSGLISPGSHNNRRDHYTAANNDLVAETIRNLRRDSGAARVIAVGHSGGAAQLGAVIGRYPGLVDAAVLVACPCDVPRWRASRAGPWPNSQSPWDFLPGVSLRTRIIAITGAQDDNTFPQLAIDYVAEARRLGIDASYVEVVGAGHGFNGLSGAAQTAVLAELARPLPPPETPEAVSFQGGGSVFGFSDACRPVWQGLSQPAQIRYSPSELNGGPPSQVSVVWPTGSEHISLWGDMVPSQQFNGAAGRAMWSYFVFYPLRPLVRVVQRQVTQPAGATLANAQELLLRLRVQNFGARTGCTAVIAATVRRM